MKSFLKKNKFIILSLGIIMTIIYGFFSTAFGAAYEELDFKYGKVKANCLNVRCGPGITYSRVGKLQKGEYINVFAKIGNWYIVQTDSNIVGAVSAEYVEAVYDESEINKQTKDTSDSTENLNNEQDNSIQNTSTEIDNTEEYRK